MNNTELFQKRIKVTVNGRETEVFEGLTILQALIQEDIHIPHLCYDIRVQRANGNCGLCEVELENDGRSVKSCQTPIKEGMKIITVSPRLEAYRKVRLEQILGDHNADCVAPCVMTCPAHIDIQTYLMQVEAGNFEAALRGIKNRNPFPIVCGRVCPHPCESQCRRNLVDSPVAINYVKRFAADWDMARETSFVPRKEDPTGKKIAVVGAGPSGLSAAYYSAINGHSVTVFERHSQPGGMMRYGIPEYRLPKAALDFEIDIMRQLGVKIVCGKSLGTNISLEDLSHDFDSVYLAIGSWRATPLQIEGENSEGVWLGINFLEWVTKGEKISLGEKVVVVGGGNTAIDCARTALRKGAKEVKLVYRRTREEMPAQSYEVDEAIHEGVEIIFLTAPLKISAEKGMKELHCIKMKLGEPDRSGRRRPVPIEDSEFTIEADTIIGAIGQSTNTQFLYNDLPVKLNKWGDIEIDGRTMQTSVEKIFSGGDCVTGPATVVQAVGAGRRAAEAMHSYLTAGYVKEEKPEYNCSMGTLEDLPRWEFEEMPRLARSKMPTISDAERLKGFAEVELGLSETMARYESRRCLRCGCSARYDCDLRREARVHAIEYMKPIHERPFFPKANDHPFIIRDHNKCISCGRCIAACAEIEGADVLSYYLKKGRMLVGTRSGKPLDETDCVSCGQCVNSCPCGALDYRRERWKVFGMIHDPGKTVVGFVAPAVRSLISSVYGLSYDKASPFIAGLLKHLGFSKVFDFTFAADLTIMEETTEFLNRVKNHGVMPQFTSCCPGWVNFVERRYPELIPHLSTCKSPQQMMGATVKTHFAEWAGIPKEDIFVVSIVPCLAKKSEAAREEFAPDGIRDVDCVLTSSELIEMINLTFTDIKDVKPAEFDEPYKQVSGAGILFGASGGVAEAALRMAVERLTGKALTEHLDFEAIRGFEEFKKATVDIGTRKLRVAVISGLDNAEEIVDKVREGADVGYDLIEVMACPGGCICGAGHPVPEKIDSLEKRQQVLINIDKTSQYRKSQENPDVIRLYSEFYGEPNSHKAHSLLHTGFVSRKDGIIKAPRMGDSVFKTQDIGVCFCDKCRAKGVREFCITLYQKLQALKLTESMLIKPLHLNENHPGDGIYIMVNGINVSESELNGFLKLSKSVEMEPFAQGE
jgi:formate dehydrogenase major subunit